jgi:hypothetical protein
MSSFSYIIERVYNAKKARLRAYYGGAGIIGWFAIVLLSSTLFPHNVGIGDAVVAFSTMIALFIFVFTDDYDEIKINISE